MVCNINIATHGFPVHESSPLAANGEKVKQAASKSFLGIESRDPSGASERARARLNAAASGGRAG